MSNPFKKSSDRNYTEFTIKDKSELLIGHAYDMPDGDIVIPVYVDAGDKKYFLHFSDGVGEPSVWPGTFNGPYREVEIHYIVKPVRL